MPQVLIQDPHNDYAVEFMRTYFEDYGLQTVAFYTDDYRRRMNSYLHPEIRSDMVAAEYRVDDHELVAFADLLQREHDIVAVVPFHEHTVENAETLAELLGLSWAQPDVIKLFRDKAALKERVRELAPDIRLNKTAAVSTLADVEREVNRLGIEHFVIKPNSGFGNADIGFFTSFAADEVRDYLAASDCGSYVLEEYVGGREFHVDGQTDEAGNVTVYDSFEEARVSVNGRDNVQFGSVQVLHNDPLFTQLADYASSVVAATGLTRSPFCLELKVDDTGPCLIEVGARLVGLHGAPAARQAHGGDFDPFKVAAHYYLSYEHLDIPVDWDHYNNNPVRIVNGVSQDDARIFQLEGLPAVEALPEFVTWFDKPEVGHRVRPTTDLFTAPYLLLLQGESNEHLASVADDVEQLIVWNNEGPITFGDKAKAAKNLAARRLAQAPRPRYYLTRRAK